MAGPQIAKLKGRTKPMSFEGGEEPLVQVFKKINEIIEVLNKK